MTRLLFISPRNHWFYRITLLSGLLAFILILLGTYSRLSGATLSCPDWPLCFGSFIPHTSGARIAMATRYLTAMVTLLIMVMAFMSAALQRQLGLRPLCICLALVISAGLQVLLNRLTFMQHTQPLIALADLLIGLTILSLLWWTSRITRPDSYVLCHPSLKPLRPWAWLALTFLLLQIIFGGWISTNFAEASCASFPYCNMHLTPGIQWHQILKLPLSHPNPQMLANIHTVHRIGAIVGFFYLGLFSFLLLFNRYIYPIAFAILLLLCLQLAVGLINMTTLNENIAIISQNVIIALLLMALISLLASLYNKPQDYWYG